MRLGAILLWSLAAPVWAGAAFEVEPWPLPAPADSAEPSLALAGDRLWLSWIERGGGGHRLRAAAWQAPAGWGDPVEIAAGRDWFVNWADFPMLSVLSDGSLWAHVLRKSAAAPYAYGVWLTRSGNGGKTWLPARQVHDDGSDSEHGFASLLPWSRDELLIAWLDGRHTVADAGGGHGARGAMSLRAAVFDPAGAKRQEWQLDASTCDCCQTGAALTPRGPLLVYRGRDPGEVRDIERVRFENGAWSAPAKVHDDGWVMPACPVNGPAVAARGEQVWVAWYTVASGVPELRLARSDDAGDHFAAPVRVARGGEVLGRVALAAGERSVWAAWLEESAGRQSLWLARYPPDLSGPAPRQVVAAPQGRGRGTGFPRLALVPGARGEDAYLVWTDVRMGEPQVQGVRVARAATSEP